MYVSWIKYSESMRPKKGNSSSFLVRWEIAITVVSSVEMSTLKRSDEKRSICWPKNFYLQKYHPREVLIPHNSLLKYSKKNLATVTYLKISGDRLENCRVKKCFLAFVWICQQISTGGERKNARRTMVAFQWRFKCKYFYHLLSLATT